ncbi:hypothetical protein [Pararhodobacter sp. CCB-MM2]|uniref:hypothetical protein n=1 Tax=Pararhodobacter sp. CCB-MM2 TaxID=1786003 RepID=UPI0013143EE6|nr:hypothetical protein [Pararhodobacter sp. CCB-MM2]MCA2011763.1 hypothetical protein [Cereibacter sphaeroides]
MSRPALSAKTRPEILHRAMTEIGLATPVTPTKDQIHATQFPSLLCHGPEGQ